ncbi:MAG: UDP-N-acetylmuramoyl-tripeptide--D-alanyl-D-alanine ligase [Patescibacteria group bacterium]|nr:UDP-N-acetylmuramoyl-tripeptide--D-alanyl-D-alanine ligase [Patescibacteria group bacterium]
MIKKTFKKITVTIITWQARLVLKRYHPKIIAITGSVGKTSTKDAIFTILSKFKTVRKSEKSYNSEIGLPLTILGCPNGWNNPLIWFENIIRSFILILKKQPYPEWLILEVGAGKPNDIKNVTTWLSPDIVVITCFPDKPVHVEFFGSVDKIIEEKSYLAFALKPDGILVLNHDDEKVYALHEKANRKTISYGFHENSTFHATYPAYKYKNENDLTLPEGISFKLEYDGNTFPVMLPHLIGMHYIGQALAAIAVAHEIGCDLLQSINAIAEYTTPPGRLSYIEGIHNSIIIDDTYNSSPVAMEAAINVLADIKSKRKIAVLGDMLELGKMTESAHREVGEKVFPIVDLLIVVGPRAKYIAEGAFDQGYPDNKIEIFDTSTMAAEFLKGYIKEGDAVLLKGSQGIRLERAVEAIMAHPELKTKLLCRQEPEWKNR